MNVSCTPQGLAQVSFEQIAAKYGTPCYIYATPVITQAYQSYSNAFQKKKHLICYAVKANSNLSLLRHLVRLGAGLDIVSEGELERALAIQCPAEKIVFSGVGKSTSEIIRAIKAQILCFNVESESELLRIIACAQHLQICARVSLRVNPNVNAQTHPYIATGLKENKFGIPICEALRLYQHAQQCKWLEVVGIDCHIGSQILQLAPFLEAFDHLLSLVDQLEEHNIRLQHIDIGGGIGIAYQGESLFSITDFANQILEKIGQRDLALIMEPGRAIVGHAGVLLTRVEYLKVNAGKHFAIVDAGISELIRPALYQAWHKITVVNPTATQSNYYDIVGPICESADFLGKNRELAIVENDLLLIHDTGAYASTMESNYNSRLKIPEIIINDLGEIQLARTRETYHSLLANEMMCL